MKRRSVGRSHAQRITRGVSFRRMLLLPELRLFSTERAFVSPSASDANSSEAPTKAMIAFLFGECLINERTWKAPSVHQGNAQKKFALERVSDFQACTYGLVYCRH